MRNEHLMITALRRKTIKSHRIGVGEGKKVIEMILLQMNVVIVYRCEGMCGMLSPGRAERITVWDGIG